VKFFTPPAHLERFPYDKADGIRFNFFKSDIFDNLLQILGRHLYELKGAILLSLPRGRHINDLAYSLLKGTWESRFNMELLEFIFESIESFFLGGNFGA
jgi:hypothetical protein